MIFWHALHKKIIYKVKVISSRPRLFEDQFLLHKLFEGTTQFTISSLQNSNFLLKKFIVNSKSVISNLSIIRRQKIGIYVKIQILNLRLKTEIVENKKPDF